MAASQKPRKKYRRRPVLNPLNMREEWAIEGDPYAVLMAMDGGCVEESHMAMLAAHADMVRRMFDPSRPERRQADTLIRIIADIKSRQELRILSGEDVAIRAALTVTIEAIRNATNADIYRSAMASMHDMDKFGGVRVRLG
jgi:hypothetical protein